MTPVIGIDIGGTKTHVALARLDTGVVTSEFVVASSSWRGALGDPVLDAVGLRELIRSRLGAEALMTRWVVGAHGCENSAQCHALEDALAEHVSGPVLVVNDSELIAPAMVSGPAIGLVVGTGSIATARNSGGELVTAGGWGWLLGDEGSAPALVREATRVVLAGLDADADDDDPLTRRLMAAFDAEDAAQLALAVTQSASAESWGRHASDVFAAADEGSERAAGVLRDAGEALARLVRSLGERGITADSVVAGGSVIERQPRLRRDVQDALARLSPGLRLTILDRAPVHGAIALARRVSPSRTIGDQYT